MNGIEIVSTGYAKIEKTLDNQQLEQMVETSNEWIVSRTGILKRHLSDKSSAFLAIEAAKKATQNQDLSQLALIIVATMTPENNTPSNACLVQKALGLNHQSMMCFDINVACSGYVYALKVAQSLLEENQYGLVIGSEQLSSIVDYQDRNTCILFGDGAGAVFLEADEKSRYAQVTHSEGEKGRALTCSSRNQKQYVEHPDAQETYMEMDGREVFKFAVSCVPQVIRELLEKEKLSGEEIRFYILHQANIRIIQSVAKRLGEAEEKFPVNIQEYGNTSGASVPILLDELNRKGCFKAGDKLVLAAFGAGLSYGASLLEWK